VKLAYFAKNNSCIYVDLCVDFGEYQQNDAKETAIDRLQKYWSSMAISDNLLMDAILELADRLAMVVEDV